jgi:hypothetical protein
MVFLNVRNGFPHGARPPVFATQRSVQVVLEVFNALRSVFALFIRLGHKRGPPRKVIHEECTVLLPAVHQRKKNNPFGREGHEKMSQAPDTEKIAALFADAAEHEALERAPRTTPKFAQDLRERWTRAHTFDLEPMLENVEDLMRDAVDVGRKTVNISGISITSLPRCATLEDLCKALRARHPDITFTAHPLSDSRTGVISFEF